MFSYKVIYALISGVRAPLGFSSRYLSLWILVNRILCKLRDTLYIVLIGGGNSAMAHGAPRLYPRYWLWNLWRWLWMVVERRPASTVRTWRLKRGCCSRPHFVSFIPPLSCKQHLRVHTKLQVSFIFFIFSFINITLLYFCHEYLQYFQAELTSQNEIIFLFIFKISDFTLTKNRIFMKFST